MKDLWTFTPRLPKNSIVISLRGLYPASGGGYGWVEKGVQSWPALKDFIHGVEALIELLDPENIPLRLIDRDCLNRINFIGFSQGAAMIYAFSLLHPERIQSISGLSGFLPDGTEAYIQKRVLAGKSVFVAHGTEDYLVPIDRARKSIELLKAAGGRVTYCEDNVGHKLSLNCFKGLELFLQRNICKPH